MAAYIGLLRKDAGSDFGVDFPDFPGCVTAAKTLTEARRLAAEVLGLHITGMLESCEPIPAPSKLDDVMSDPANRGAISMLVNAPALADFHAAKIRRKH